MAELSYIGPVKYAFLAVGLLSFTVGCSGCSSTEKSKGTTPTVADAGFDKADPNRDSPCQLGGYGACIAVSACAPAMGHISSAACAQADVVCCAPLDKCPGDEDFACCANGTEFRPVCDGMMLGCPYGQKKGTKGACPPAGAAPADAGQD